jgi:hypothetical protein
MDMKVYILLVLLFLLFIFVLYSNTRRECMTITDNVTEHMDNEAIANIASIYNTQLAQFDNVVTSTVSTPILKSTGTINVQSPLTISNQLCVDNVCVDTKHLKSLIRTYQSPYIYSPMSSDSITYDDIFAAQTAGVVSKNGSPTGYDSTTYPPNNKWLGTYPILNIGTGTDSSPTGITVTVPSGMNVIWFRVLNDRWTTLTIKGYLKSTCGYRNIVKTRPDGGDDTGTLHRWVQYPVAGPGQYNIYGADSSHSPGGNWLSGIGFSTNPYNHVMSSGVAYFWNLNGGSNVSWLSSSWPNNDGSTSDGGDNLAYIPKNTSNSVLIVPVINSGNDKILYILSIGRMPDNTFVTKCKVTINGTVVNNFFRCNNVFAQYYNNKPSLSYFGTIIPASLVTSNSLSVSIDTTSPYITDNVYLREIGTHDY